MTSRREFLNRARSGYEHLMVHGQFKPAPSNTKPCLVFARNYDDARRWALHEGYPPNPPRGKYNWRYAWQVRHVEGLRDVRIVLVAGFMDRHNAHELYEVIRRIESMSDGTVTVEEVGRVGS